MSRDVVIIGLCLLAGLLFGGVYATWRSARTLAVALLVLGVLAGAAAVAWLV